MVLDHWDQDRDILERAKKGKDSFEDDSCVKQSSHFEQADEFFVALKALTEKAFSVEEHNEVQEDKWLKKAIALIDPYQEQPYLLDPHLENMVKPVIEILRTYIKSHALENIYLSKSLEERKERVQVSKTMKRLFRLIYYIMKIRGYKTVVKLFTHEVSDLEPTFCFLSSLSPIDYDAWEMRYVLLIWLSLICMIPFDLKTVDSRAVADSDKIPLVDEMVTLSKYYLNATGKERDGAAVLLSRLLTRRDIAKAYLSDYVQWATEEAKRYENVFVVTGILTSLCAIYKLGHRGTLLSTVDTVWPCLFLTETNQNFANNTLVRKLLVKLSQRFGMCYLRPKVAAWRYQRGNRSLKDNLEASNADVDSSNVLQNLMSIDDDADEEIPEQIEEIIEMLLKGLRNKDTVVRWSAAKGIGRLTHRLPQELADDVVGSLLELFSENTFMRDDVLDLSSVSDNTWHGACLAVAELARRGLLLPKRLDEVFPWVIKALKFDLRRGNYSIGSHVRDAACYVCWSFARAYEPAVLASHASELANSLVVISVFDREVNVRRASSAAFQENVGRQGIFPHGIDIITTADYFTVGNRVNSFLEISVKIADYLEYRYHLINHLVTITISNWDKNIRELASKALHNLTFLDVDHMVSKVLPSLIPKAICNDLQTHHGALLAVGEVCLAWAKLHGENREWVDKHKDLVTSIAMIPSNIPGHFFADFGSELTCQGASHLIACLAKAKWPIDKETRVVWEDVVYDLLRRKDEYGQELAVRAVEAVMSQYGIDSEEIDRIHPSKNAYNRRGFSLALGVLEYKKVPQELERVVDALIESSRVQKTKVWNDAETRRNAIIALSNIAKNLGDDFKSTMTHTLFNKILNAYFASLEDFSIDQRGDVGSWVREVGMKSLGSYVPLITRNDDLDPTSPQWWTKDLSMQVVKKLLKQSVERIDKIRACAGTILIDLLYEKRMTGEWVLDINGRSVLERVLNRDEEIHWINPSELYPRMIQLLVLPEYRFDLLAGLVVAAGGMTESLVRYSSATLIKYASSLPPFATDTSSISLLDFANTLLEVFRVYEKQDRVVVPLLEVIDLLFEAGALQKGIDCGFDFQELFDKVKKEVSKCRDIRKLGAGVRVYCGFVTLGGTLRTKALQHLLSYLVHPFPKIRRLAADQLYITLTATVVEDEPDEMVEIEEILSTIDWSDPVSKLKEIRDRLYPLLNVPKPTLRITGDPSAPTTE